MTTSLSFLALTVGARVGSGQPCAVRVDFRVGQDLVFDPDVSIGIATADGASLYAGNLRQALGVGWLPRGDYRLHWLCGTLALPAGPYRLVADLWCGRLGQHEKCVAQAVDFEVEGEGGSAPLQGSWQLEALNGARPIETLAWHRGAGDWFHRHFDHAAGTVISYMLGNSPLLRGRILDVGCGDGITDLGIALRCEPELLVGADPFRGFDRLPEILRDNHLPQSLIPSCLRFDAVDANALPYPDNSFDVVLSWGSLEHIAGGYDKALAEIRRVLRDGGLFFVHPGLFYSDAGSHLTEFSDEPLFHLKKSREALRDFILSTEPRRMDRSGHDATPAEYWQWFTELNPITVAGFEKELRALGFEPWRVAIRCVDRIEYTPEIQHYPMQDLATSELYVSAYLRKPL
jgi:ubiquinone/menaquinone biosynthesis C-methylase UbiE